MRWFRNLPLATLILGGCAALAASPDPREVTGTWVLTQGISIGEADSPTVGALSVVELLHLDADGEVREVSSLFREGGCGRELPLVPGTSMRVPFTASLGIGHWRRDSDDDLRISSYHLLFDCTGAVVGVAWALREARLTWEDELRGGERNGIGGAAPLVTRGRPLEWSGRTTIELFTLAGQPLPLPLFSSPLRGSGDDASRITGPFRARRLSGDPIR